MTLPLFQPSHAAPEDLLGFVELHIEQGPTLLTEGWPVGIVTSIAAPVRLTVRITGASGHAGTVPMALRHDALAAAAEIILAVEQRCRDEAGLVGTVGVVKIPDAAGNVIPGYCDLSLDIRAADNAARDAAVDDILAEIDRIASRRGVRITSNEVMRANAVACSPRFQALLADATAAAGITPRFLPSGAGHDAMVFDGMTESRCCLCAAVMAASAIRRADHHHGGRRPRGPHLLDSWSASAAIMR